MTKEWLKVLTFEQIMRNASNFSTVEKIHHLTILEEALERKLGKIQFLKQRNQDNFKLCKIGIVFQRTMGSQLGEEVYEYVGTNYDVKYRKENRTGFQYFNQFRDQLDAHRVGGKDSKGRPDQASTASADAQVIDKS